MKYYVAYGSNLNIRQMLRRCPGAKLVRTWVLIHYELQFRGSKTGAYLTVVKKKNGTAPVAVWKITEEDEKRLDRYEGYPNFYYKKTIPWKNMDAEVFMYVMHEDRPLGIPSESYYEICRQGYEDFGFTEERLKDALKISQEALEKNED